MGRKIRSAATPCPRSVPPSQGVRMVRAKPRVARSTSRRPKRPARIGWAFAVASTPDRGPAPSRSFPPIGHPAGFGQSCFQRAMPVRALDRAPAAPPRHFPGGQGSTTVRGVALRRTPASYNDIGERPTPVTPTNLVCLKEEGRSVPPASRLREPRARAHARRTRAHSSIGQSPRLITGLFLVRTQVGLPTTPLLMPVGRLRS